MFLGEDDTEFGGCEPLSSSRIESSDAADNDRPCSYASQVGTDFDLWLIAEEFEACQDESNTSPYEAAHMRITSRHDRQAIRSS